MRDDTLYTIGRDRKARLEDEARRKLAGPQHAHPSPGHLPPWAVLAIVVVLLAILVAVWVWPGLIGL